MNVFIDDFDLLRIESDKFIEQIELKDNEVNWLKTEGFNQFFVAKYPIRLHLDDSIIINNKKYLLKIGLVTLTREFEMNYRYNKQLGSIYQNKSTIFRLFSPVAKEVNLILDNNKYKMKYKNPIWEVEVNGDFDQKQYQFEIRLEDKFNLVNDPYAYALTNGVSTVIDLTKVKKPTPLKQSTKEKRTPIIYEGHVRDLSTFLDVEEKGKFRGLINKSKELNGSVLEYIKSLGVNRLQLLPIFDFEGLDDNDPSVYNWGYNPRNMFALQSAYQSEKDNPYSAINDFIEVVDYAHKIGLGIHLDVVYNHVYSRKTFPFDYIVPGYYYRHDNKYKMTDSSHCGNDLETRNHMARKFIVDNLVHLLKSYDVDGFRFDLMGLIDIKTLKQAERELKKIKPNIMLYGEGWDMDSSLNITERANIRNQSLFPYYSHFNDTYRNMLKGNLDASSIGYAFGKPLSNVKVTRLLKGIRGFNNPRQSINYVECHDNLTFFDHGILNNIPESEIKIYQDFANHFIAISAGIPFYHAGSEMYRSKQSNDNSYNAPDDINGIKYNLDANQKKLKQILSIRKNYLNDKILYTAKMFLKGTYSIVKAKSLKGKLLIIVKNNFSNSEVPIKDERLIFSSQKAIKNKTKLLLNKPGVYILLKEM